jgi:hypothetical protein
MRNNDDGGTVSSQLGVGSSFETHMGFSGRVALLLPDAACISRYHELRYEILNYCTAHFRSLSSDELRLGAGTA